MQTNDSLNIFVPVVGQYTNIGDVLHRRVLLSWLRPCGTLHVYTGGAPSGFTASLLPSDRDVIHPSARTWCVALFKALTHGAAVFAFNSGEMRFVPRRWIYEALLAPWLFAVRARHGAVMRVGVGIGRRSPCIPALLWRPFFASTGTIVWRTASSREIMQTGSVAPDLAFYGWDSAAAAACGRNLLVVSMRGDRREPSDNWIRAIGAFARRAGLEIVTATQVRKDGRRNARIGAALKARAVMWPDDVSHFRQESILNGLYARTALVISDRLHVLIAGVARGAMPACVLTEPSTKIAEHFAVLGLEDICMHEEGQAVRDVVGFLDSRFNDGPRVRHACREARRALDEVRLSIQKSLRATADRNRF